MVQKFRSLRNNEATYILIKYALKLIKAAPVKVFAKTVPKIQPEILAFKKDIENNYYYQSQLWRPVFAIVCQKGCNRCLHNYDCLDSGKTKKGYCKDFIPNWDAIKAEFDIPKADVLFVLERLKTADKTLIRKKAKSLRIAPINEQIKNNILKSITSYVKWIAFSKLRYLAQYHHEEQEDFENELFICAISVMNKQDSCKIPLKLENIIKKSVHNHALNIIEKANRFKRARIVQDNQGYQTNLITLDKSVNSDGDQYSLYDILAETEKDLTVCDAIGLKDLRKKLKSISFEKPNLNFLIKIILGKRGTGFFRYRAQVDRKAYPYEEWEPDELMQEGSEYLNLTEKDLQELQRVFKEFKD